MVKSGDVLKVEKLVVEEGKKIVFDKVLLSVEEDGSDLKIGRPFVAGAKVEGVVLKQGKNRTVRVEKFKRKIRYHKVYGQRQKYTQIKIV